MRIVNIENSPKEHKTEIIDNAILAAINQMFMQKTEDLDFVEFQNVFFFYFKFINNTLSFKACQ